MRPIDTKKLNNLIQENYYTYVDLMKLTGLSNTGLVKIRTGKSKVVHPSTLKKLCKVLKCEPNDILKDQEQ